MVNLTTPSSSSVGQHSSALGSIKEIIGGQARRLQNAEGAGFARGYADVVANRP